MRLIAAAFLACTMALGAAQAALKPVPLSFNPDPPTLAGAQEAANQVRGTHLPRRLQRDPTRARQFVFLAAKHQDPDVVAAALEAMPRAWSRKARKGRRGVDADYRAVVLARLSAAQPGVRWAALRATRLVFSGDAAGEKIFARVLEMVEKGGPAGRLNAVRALSNVAEFQVPRARPGKRKARAVKAVLTVLSAKEPYLLAVALDRLARSAYPGLPLRDAVFKAALPLVSHPAAEVRGSALTLVARLAKKGDRETVGRLTAAALADPDPFVRGAGTEAAATVGWPPLAHALMPLLDQTMETGMIMSGWPNMDGSKGSVRFVVEAGRRMDEAALAALEKVSRGPKGFDAPSLSGKDRKTKRAKAIALATAWYAAHKAKLPALKLPPKAAPPKAAPAQVAPR